MTAAVFARGAFVPAVAGKGLGVRAVNKARRTVPRLTHLVDALLRLRLAERKTGLIWRAVLRVPAAERDRVIHLADLKSGLPQLVALTDPRFVSVGGLTYEVTPASAGFVTVDAGLSRRTYETYQDYIRHQASKLEKEAEFVHRTSEERYRKMAARFEKTVASAGLSGHVLCLGARLGEEVRAFRSAGLPAIGVDLNPGAGNRDCLAADFHYLPFRTGAFDGAYSNVLDHVYDMQRFMAETVRVVRPGGFVYFELSGGFQETGAVDPYGATLWPTNAALLEALVPFIGRVIIDEDNAAKARRVLVFRTIGSNASSDAGKGQTS